MVRRTVPGHIEYDDAHYRGSSEIALPQDIDLKSGIRVGDNDRANTINHLTQMKNTGHLTEAEADKRIQHAATAENAAMLRHLTTDLPAPFDTRPWYHRDWKKAKIPALLFGMFLSACSAIVPGFVMSTMKVFPETALGQAIFIPLLVAGIIGFFTCLITILVHES